VKIYYWDADSIYVKFIGCIPKVSHSYNLRTCRFVNSILRKVCTQMHDVFASKFTCQVPIVPLHQTQAEKIFVLCQNVLLYLLTYLIRSSYTLRCRGCFFHLDHFTDGRTPWTGDQFVAKPLPKHRTTHTHTKHPCLVWDSNPRSRLQSERRQFMH
jgi:hypothetical protein